MGSQGTAFMFRQSLNDLPEEIAVKILSQITDQSTLHNLVLTSRRVYRICLPLLYRYITHEMYHHPPRIHSAIRTLLKKPELAQKVEFVAIKHPQACENFWDLKSWATYDNIQPFLSI
jgi:hypothetical protein